MGKIVSELWHEVWGCGGIAPQYLFDICTRWRWIFSFTPRSLYARGNRLRYTLYRRLGGPQSRSGRCGEETNLTPAGNQTPAVQPVARCHTD
jgi:hypothetical protein